MTLMKISRTENLFQRRISNLEMFLTRKTIASFGVFFLSSLTAKKYLVEVGQSSGTRNIERL